MSSGFHSQSKQASGRVMAMLPDEIWQRILESGAETCRLDYRDLCCLSIASRRLNRLSLDPTLWAILLARDFPSPTSPPSKSLFKTMYERDKSRKIMQWRRKVLNAESQLAMCKNKLTDLESMMMQENKKLRATAQEITNLERTRSASVALNVWQPEVVRGRQKQMVEQCTVPIQSRLDSLKMEFQVCKQQIATYSKAYDKEKKRFREHEEAVRSLKYQPLQGNQLVPEKNEVKIKRKKLKNSHCKF
ncbi:F-box protein SKIP24 [Rhynchospora pubera]|uniref:F-box protein SKIP24 n=1 Tax=Rhynchospora pubera TaxID=906938 RepID=A0AAV8C978_9POAL|nr:F-box protein SKIP24 [Rhynchospora pubera]